MTNPPGGDYDAYADEVRQDVAWREQGGPGADPDGILPPMLDLLGDLGGRRVLDAGCGEGYLARVLAASGAQVTGMDISPRLIEQARSQDPDGAIDYRVADLSRPLPEQAASFDAMASHLVLNDVPDYRGFARTIAGVLRPGGRAGQLPRRGVITVRHRGDQLVVIHRFSIAFRRHQVRRRGKLRNTTEVPPAEVGSGSRGPFRVARSGSSYACAWRYRTAWWCIRGPDTEEDLGFVEGLVHPGPPNSPGSPNPPL
jgi:SAM-dependent methyltransferase